MAKKVPENSVWHVSFYMGGGNPQFKWDDLPYKSRGWDYAVAYGDKLTEEVIAQLPTSATQEDKKKVFDFGPMPEFNWCSQKFRDVVESIEPDVHNFFPVTLKAKDGTPHEGQFYIFSPGQAFPAILIDETNAFGREVKGFDWDTITMGHVRHTHEPYWGGGGTNLVVSRSTAAGRHLWGNVLIGGPGYFFSGPMMRAMKDNRVKRLGAHECYWSDTPWIMEEQVAPWLDWYAERPELRDDLDSALKRWGM